MKLITAASLRSRTSKDLAQMAKEQGVTGWRTMRKDDLVKELLRLDKSTSKSKVVSRAISKAKIEQENLKTNTPAEKSIKVANGNGSTKRATNTRSNGINSGKKAVSRRLAPSKSASKPNARVNKIIREQNAERQKQKDLARLYESGESSTDGIVLIVRDSYWLQACWSILPQTVKRCQVALAEEWHLAQPVIRLFAIKDHGSTHGVEDFVRDIPIHGGVRNWYIDVQDPPSEFRVALGYLTANSKFHLIAKSNIVATPFPGKCDSMKGHWEDIAENHQKYFALSGGYTEGKATDELRNVFEQQLRRPMSSPSMGHVSSSTFMGSLDFQVDAEMIVFGSVDPNASVTLGGEPIQVQPDGSFKIQMSMPDRRQVLPVVACSRDGSQQRTTVLAIEKNTKTLEAVNCEPDEG